MFNRASIFLFVPLIVAGVCVWAWLGGGREEAARAVGSGGLGSDRTDSALVGDDVETIRGGRGEDTEVGARVQPGGADGLFVLHGELRDPGGELLTDWAGVVQLVESPPTATINILGKQLYAARLDGQGGYRVEGLPAGEYIAFAYSELVTPLQVAFELEGTPRSVRRDFELEVPMVVNVIADDPVEFSALGAFTGSGAHKLLLTASVARGAGEREVARLEPATHNLLEFRVAQPGQLGELVVNARPPVTLRLTYGTWVIDELRVVEWTKSWRVGLAGAGIESAVGEVRVRFVDAEGRPTRAGRPLLHALGGGQPARERSYEDGTCRFRLVPPGEYLLTLTAPNAFDRARRLEFSSFDPDLVIDWTSPDSGTSPGSRGVVLQSSEANPTAGPIAVSVGPGALVDLGDVVFQPGRAFKARVVGLADDDPRNFYMEFASLQRGARNRLFPFSSTWGDEEVLEYLPRGEFAVRAQVAADDGVAGSLGFAEQRPWLGTPWLVFNADALPTEASLQLEPLRSLVVQNPAEGPAEWTLRDELGLRVAGGTLSGGASELTRVPPGRYVVESIDVDGVLERQSAKVGEDDTRVELGAR